MSFVYIDNNQNWESTDSSYRAAEHRKARRNGEARIAEAHGAAKQQQLTKDIYLPASIAKDMKEAPWEKAGTQSPPLPAPTKSFGGFEEDEDTHGMISIISAAAIAQEKCNTHVFVSLWRQATESMLQQVAFAPIIGQAVESSYTAMSNATKQDATQALAEGVINFVGFGLSVGTAIFLEVKDPEKPSGDSNTNAVTKQPNNLTNEELSQDGKNASKALGTDSDSVNDVEKTAANATKKQSFWRKLFDKFINKTSKGKIMNVAEEGKATISYQQRFLGFIAKLNGGTIQTLQMISVGTKGVVDNAYQTSKANYQSQQGVADALSKEAEQYSQFYGQDFSRTDSLGNATQQYFDFAAHIWNSSVEAVANSVTSMFRP